MRLLSLFVSKKELPVVMQAESSECGLACLSMISSYYGYKTDLLTLRERFQFSLKGTTMAHLMEISSTLEMAPRPIRVELGDLGKFRNPAILHWDLNHFVVLKRVKKNRVYIHDPAVGLRKLNMDEVSKHFTGVVLDLTPSPNFKRGVEKKRLSVWQLWGRQSGVFTALIRILLLSLVLEGFAIASPLFMQLVVDRVLVANSVSFLTVLGLGFMMLALVNVSVGALRSWMILYLSTHLNFQMVGQLFSHLIRLPSEFYERRHVGDIVSRFESMKTIQKTMSTQLIESVVDGVMAVGTLAIMYWYSSFLSLVATALILFYAVVRNFLYKALYRATEEQITSQADAQTSFLENVRGIQSIRLFGAETSRQSSWQNLFARSLNASIKASKVTIAMKSLDGLLQGAGIVAITWIGARLIIKGEFSLGMLFAFISFQTQLTSKASGLIEKYMQYRMLSLHADRVSDIALTSMDRGFVNQPKSGKTRITGELTTRNLGYRYASGENYVIKGVSLCFPAGKSVAIIGPSGCGKTTLLKVMIGLFSPSEGSVLIDGIDVMHFGLNRYRAEVGAVMQDDQLFAGSLSENISFYDTHPDQSRIEECARLSAVHEDIIAMPMGYNSLIGDMGTVLSGGQKQRVLLARALYKRSRILFLDEATSHLDAEREKEVMDAIRGLKMTRIMVAHRYETIRNADHVVDLTEHIQLAEAAG